MTVDFRQLADVACETLGGSVLHATDDFFAEKERLIEASAPEWREHDYTPRGKWMDGWESRRKRAIGEHVHDEVVVRLAMPVVVRGIIVDTSFFRGNFPEGCEIDGCCARADASVEAAVTAVPPRPPPSHLSPRCWPYLGASIVAVRRRAEGDAKTENKRRAGGGSVKEKKMSTSTLHSPLSVLRRQPKKSTGTPLLSLSLRASSAVRGGSAPERGGGPKSPPDRKPP